MYLHEDHYYLISNHAVARNSIFCDIGIQIHFRNKMKMYLEPLCDILAFDLKDHEFKILVRLKDREAFETFYEQKSDQIEGLYKVPKSTYIFSQAMSNLQVSLVKKFNFRYNRSGTLMASRFTREIITSKESVIELIQDLNNSMKGMKYTGIWADCAMKRVVAMTSKSLFKSMEQSSENRGDEFWIEFKNDLVGKFSIPQINVQNFKFHYLNRKLFKAMCNYQE